MVIPGIPISIFETDWWYDLMMMLLPQGLLYGVNYLGVYNLG